MDQPDADFAVTSQSRDIIRSEGSVRLALPDGRTVLTSDARAVEAVVAGRVPRGAVRLDGRRS